MTVYDKLPGAGFLLASLTLITSRLLWDLNAASADTLLLLPYLLFCTCLKKTQINLCHIISNQRTNGPVNMVNDV